MCQTVVMKDLTKGSIPGHIVTLATPLLVGMVAQIAYQLVDLYFVARIGAAAIAGVNAAANAVFLVAALTAVLNVGTAPLIAHAVGRKDSADANLIFNQSLLLAGALGVLVAVLLWLLGPPYVRSIAADSQTVDAGSTFILWMLPGLALSCPMVGLNAALRGSGTVQPGVIIHTITVILNALLAPVLISGWGTGKPFGVMGAGLATSISIAVGLALFVLYFHRYERFLQFRPTLVRPQLDRWRAIVAIGLPAGGEFTLTFLSTATVYFAIRDFGAQAQAAFGIGSRVLQVILLPAMAIGFAIAPIAAQNLGARNHERVLLTFRQSMLIGTLITAATAALVEWHPQTITGIFASDADTNAATVRFLRLMALTFVVQSWVYICSSMFQALGNTLPALLSSAARFLVFAASLIVLSLQSGFRIEHAWYLLAGSIVLQALLSLWLLRIELGRKLLSDEPDRSSVIAHDRAR